MAKMSRDKGKRGELECAELLRKHGFEARRGQQFSGGDGSPDVVHSIPGLHIEVKRCEQLSIYKAMKQATKDAKELIPTVFHRRNNQDWLVVIKAEDFLGMINDIEEEAWCDGVDAIRHGE